MSRGHIPPSVGSPRATPRQDQTQSGGRRLLANTETRDRGPLLGVTGLALMSAFLAVTWVTPFASDASSEDLGAFLGTLVVPLLTLVSGALLLSVGLVPLFSLLSAAREGRAPPSKTIPSSMSLARLAMLLGVLGGGFAFVGWEMASPTTCSASHTSSMGIIGPICPIPQDVSLLSDGFMIVGGLLAGAAVLFAVARRTGSRRITPLKSRLGPD